MEIIWHGTAAVEINTKQQTILFDPFVPLPGSPVPVKLSDYDDYDTVFVTHGHFDHIASLPAISARNPKMRIYCSRTPWEVLQKKGIPRERLRCIGYGQILQIGDITVRTYHGRHAVLPKASPGLLWTILRRGPLKNLLFIMRENRICKENDETILYELTVEGKTILVMGSLNLRDEVDYPTECDLLILPYNGWEDNYPPAVKVIERLKPKKILLDHYDDTFPPVTGEIDPRPVKEFGIRFGIEISSFENQKEVIENA